MAGSTFNYQILVTPSVILGHSNDESKMMSIALQSTNDQNTVYYLLVVIYSTVYRINFE